MRKRPAPRTACLAFVLAVALPSIPAAATHLTTARFHVHARGDVGRADLERLSASAEAVADRVAALTALPIPAVDIYLYPSIEAKGLATGYTLPAHALAGRSEVHAALEDGFPGMFEYELARMLLRMTLGRPALESLESGLAAWLSPKRDDDLYYAGRIARADGIGASAVLFDERAYRVESPLVSRFLSCALAAFLVEEWGEREIVSRYSSWRGDGGIPVGFIAFLDSLYARPSPARAAARPALPSFQRGFCHAHEGYNISDGYGSRQSDLALEKLAALGTNAVSLTPFTYMRNPDRPAPLPFSDGGRSENDESVVHAARVAHRLGMAVMLKPHLWLRGSWPGAVEMSDDAAWDRFFDYYYRWIRHYAILAALHDMEVLCVGTELSAATVGNESRWKALVERLRVIYDGKITYAANWWGEYERVDFWEAFDFIGVNCYYPLSDAAQPDDEELAAGAAAALDRIEETARRYGRSVVITEVGFASAPSPWAKPHERRRGVEADETAQARCYEVFFRELAGRSAIAGVYWWKWPSFLAYGGPRHTGFTPNGKEAEGVVRRWYGGSAGAGRATEPR